MNRFQKTAPKSAGIKIAAQHPEIVAILAGRTLWEVGNNQGFDDNSVSIEYTVNPKTNEEIASLGVKINDQTYVVPFSKKIDRSLLSNADYFLSCMFRKSNKAVIEADGTPKLDEKGNPVYDETVDYLSFGKPDGLKSIRSEGAFAEMTEEELANVKAGA